MGRRGRSFTAIVAIGIAAALVAVGLAAQGANPSPAAAAAQGRPNIVVVMTDDQTSESMKVMTHVNSLIGDQGVTFANSFVNFSLCCPSRATFLTGQYAHN